jgi:hypothetical protein
MISVHRACTMRVRPIQESLENRAVSQSVRGLERSWTRLTPWCASQKVTRGTGIAFPGEQPCPLLEPG